MPFILRAFLAWHDGEYVVMPGGLTRCNPKGEDMIVSLQQGSVSKDTWILQDTPTESGLVHLAPGRISDALRHSAATPSRMADNFFWLGRYLERCSQLVRQLEKIDPLLRDDIAVLDPGVADDTLGLVLRAQGLPAPADATLDQRAGLVRRGAADRSAAGSLAANLDLLAGLLERIRLQLPPDSHPLVRQLRRRIVAFDAAACVGLKQQLTIFEGVTADAMPRDPAWRFLDLGRRLERSMQLLGLLRDLLHPADGSPPTEFRLQTLLHLADSFFSYRSVFRGALDPMAALDWLFLSPENPRGLRFQVEAINEHLGTLPESLSPLAVGELRTLAFRLLSDVRLANLSELAANPAAALTAFGTLQNDFAAMNSRLTEIYFSHASMR